MDARIDFEKTSNIYRLVASERLRSVRQMPLDLQLVAFQLYLNVVPRRSASEIGLFNDVNQC